jgi:hypothetical protein
MLSPVAKQITMLADIVPELKSAWEERQQNHSLMRETMQTIFTEWEQLMEKVTTIPQLALSQKYGISKENERMVTETHIIRNNLQDMFNYQYDTNHFFDNNVLNFKCSQCGYSQMIHETEESLH